MCVSLPSILSVTLAGVCGSNGQSYNSTCHLLQYTAGVQVAHAGRCNDTRCSGGMVREEGGKREEGWKREEGGKREE